MQRPVPLHRYVVPMEFRCAATGQTLSSIFSVTGVSCRAQVSLNYAFNQMESITISLQVGDNMFEANQPVTMVLPSVLAAEAQQCCPGPCVKLDNAVEKH